MQKIMYRSEDSSGSGVRDIIDVMVFEIYELGNTDILEYVSEHYLSDDTKQVVDNLIDTIDNGNEISEDDIREICENIIDEINKKTKHNLQVALWLADKEVVRDMYADDELNIDAYYTSDIILSDLGYDGILFAYDTEPEPINNINESLLLEYSLNDIYRMSLPKPTNKTNFKGFTTDGAGNSESSDESYLLPNNPNRQYAINKGRRPNETATGSDDEDEWWHYTDPYIAEITPQEYFDLCYKYIFHKTPPSLDEALKLPEIDENNVKEYAEAMQNGSKFLMPYLNFRTENQEGRHRALAAYLAGIETIPCEIII